MGRKPKRARRAPAIVPRFLKGAVTVGAIPSLAAACHKQTAPRAQPVVAYYSQPQPPPPVVAAYALDAGPAVPPPHLVVVAAYAPKLVTPDAAVDAPPGPPTGNPRDTFVPPPAVVAAYVPHDLPPEPEKPKTKPKAKKKP